MITITGIVHGQRPASSPTGCITSSTTIGQRPWSLARRTPPALARKTDKGTDIAIALDRGDQLVDGAVLRSRTAAPSYCGKRSNAGCAPARDADAALRRLLRRQSSLEGGFEPGALLVATQGPAEHYVDRLEHLVTSGRITWSAE
jgi:urease accessory protein